MRSKINHNKYISLKAISDGVNSTLGIEEDFTTLNGRWNTAVHYNKIQNRLIKEGEDSSIVHTMSFFCIRLDRLNEYVVRANKKFTRNEWFALITLHDKYLPYEEAKYIMNNL